MFCTDSRRESLARGGPSPSALRGSGWLGWERGAAAAAQRAEPVPTTRRAPQSARNRLEVCFSFARGRNLGGAEREIRVRDV